MQARMGGSDAAGKPGGGDPEGSLYRQEMSSNAQIRDCHDQWRRERRYAGLVPTVELVDACVLPVAQAAKFK